MYRKTISGSLHLPVAPGHLQNNWMAAGLEQPLQDCTELLFYFHNGMELFKISFQLGSQPD